MKTILWIGGFCGALAAMIVYARREKPIVTMAHQLEHAWADHHTTA